ncbi:hypothetical protein TRVA0_042S00936 [Trichomonascus vanleenenianus]|uniref:uncharacterized protein n=1 Tax=Trichomonascus vanleenenianus TaxID=2268995 RepID=UPI003EC9E11A
MFLAFQRMLDKWKPTVEFYLGVNTHEVKGDKGYIDIEGMNIRELYVSRRGEYDLHDYDSDEEGDNGLHIWLDDGTAEFAGRVELILSFGETGRALPMPLSRTQGKAPIEWRDLACVSKDLTRLSISADCNAFESLSVPDTVKHLHVSNFKVTNFARSKLMVSRTVEYLYVTDYCDFVRKRAPSVLAWFELKQATQLKTLQYGGPEIPTDLEKAVLEVEGSLESLSVQYLKEVSNGTAKFRPLASKGLGIKQLQVRIAHFNLEKDDYESYIGTYPELDRLNLDLIPFGTTASPDDRRFIKTLLARFLRGCPKLSRLQLSSSQRLDSAQERISWVSPCKFGGYIVHEIDLAKFKATIL